MISFVPIRSRIRVARPRARISVIAPPVWQAGHTCEEISGDATEATVAAELGERLGRWRANVRGALSEHFMDRMGDERGPLRRRHSGKGRAVPELSPFDPDLHFASREPCFGGTPDSKRAARGSDVQ
jgi:hypothetical protein